MRIFLALFAAIFVSTTAYSETSLIPTESQLIGITPVIPPEDMVDACPVPVEEPAGDSYENSAPAAPTKSTTKVDKLCCEAYDKNGQPINTVKCLKSDNNCVNNACARCAKCKPKMYCDGRTARPYYYVYCTKNPPPGGP